MLRKKMLRDIKQNLSQFITIFLMLFIGVMAYSGIESYMDGMQQSADSYYEKNNLQDLNVIGANFTEEDLDKIKSIEHVKDAERKLSITATDAKNNDITYLLNFIESNNISKFYAFEGEKFDVNKSGAWLDSFYAKEKNVKVGDTIKIKYDNFVLEEKVIGLVNIPDHVYDVKDASELYPSHDTFGIVYLSINEFPESYIKENAMKQMGIDNEELFDKYVKDFDYKEHLVFNYVMVDVDKKKNNDSVKNAIEDQVENAKAIIKIEDSSSYSTYQGEIDEGKAYVGIFSGLFIIIALLSVVTTMTRVVKKQRMQIGTLKALGFKNRKILLHYISYGFYISLIASIFGLLAGRYLMGNFFMNLEMTFFEMPNGVAILNSQNYICALLVIVLVSIVTMLTCYKELKENPAETLRVKMPKVKKNSLNLTTKGIFKNLSFSSKWNLRDIVRNKARTLTGLVGIVGCCMLIVCAFGMLNSLNRFVEMQFDELFNFDYKLTLKENITKEELEQIESVYGDASSKSLGIEIKNKDTRESNNAFITDAKDYVRFEDDKNNYIKLDNDEGIYVTYKLAETNNYKIGETIKWHIYGDSTYYESKIVGFNKDPQNQNITLTRKYAEKLGIDYIPDSIYTNKNLKNIKSIKNVELIQNINNLKDGMANMLNTMKSMIVLIIFIACFLGVVIIYNMGILSYSEKQYQFSTIKVLGFKDKQIKKIYIKQNLWISIVAILIGCPLGYYLTDWLFKMALDETYDFSAYIKPLTYVYASVGTFVLSYIVSKILAKKIKNIDIVSSLKGNE